LLNSIFSDPRAFQILLIFISLFGIAVIIFAYCKKEKKLDKARESRTHPGRDSEETPAASETMQARTPAAGSNAPSSPGPPSFSMLKPPRGLADAFRALLVILSIVVAAGFILILLPQPAVDSLIESIRSRYGTPLEERLALLYLGDEVWSGGL
jgi:hypothetical protein